MSTRWKYNVETDSLHAGKYIRGSAQQS